MPTAADYALLLRFPPAIDDMGDTSPGTVEGSGWYGVVTLDINPASALANDLKVNKVAICVEQFTHTPNGRFVAWSVDALELKYTGPEAADSKPKFMPWQPLEQDRKECAEAVAHAFNDGFDPSVVDPEAYQKDSDDDCYGASEHSPRVNLGS